MNKSYALNLGWTMGAISIVLFLITAIVQGGMIFSFAIGIISIAIIIGLPIAFVRRQRSASDGVIAFKEVFYTAFVGLAIGTFIYLLFSYIYVNFIDTSYLETMINQQIQTTAKFMQSLPEADMIKALTKMENDIRKGFSLSGMARNFGFYLIGYAIYSLILAAIMKKRPLFVSDSEMVIDN